MLTIYLASSDFELQISVECEKQGRFGSKVNSRQLGAIRARCDRREIVKKQDERSINHMLKYSTTIEFHIRFATLVQYSAHYRYVPKLEPLLSLFKLSLTFVCDIATSVSQKSCDSRGCSRESI